MNNRTWYCLDIEQNRADGSKKGYNRKIDSIDNSNRDRRSKLNYLGVTLDIRPSTEKNLIERASVKL